MKLLGTIFGGLSFGIVGFIIAELIKENSDVVDDYNELLEFVNSHDFYKKQEFKSLAVVNESYNESGKVKEFSNGFKLYTGS